MCLIMQSGAALTLCLHLPWAGGGFLLDTNGIHRGLLRGEPLPPDPFKAAAVGLIDRSLLPTGYRNLLPHRLPAAYCSHARVPSTRQDSTSRSTEGDGYVAALSFDQGREQLDSGPARLPALPAGAGASIPAEYGLADVSKAEIICGGGEGTAPAKWLIEKEERCGDL